MTDQQLAEKLASAFIEKIQACFSAEELAEVDRRNKTPEYGELVCATHDFADTNEQMSDAFKQVTMRWIDANSEADCELWGAAWDIAKKRGFSHDVK